MSLRHTENSQVDEDEGNISKKTASASKKNVVFFTWSEGGNPLLGNRSVKMTCSNCRQAIHSKVYFKPSWKSYVATAFFSLIGCCCIPAYYKLYHQGQHFCPLCQIYLGHTGTEWSWVRTRTVTRSTSTALFAPHHRL